jgi:NAD(P)-dependent dehydrogenase (short-subunit alcohol dehydrogenase family)
MELRGKVALVTGGASGLGEACVRRFVAQGARVAILDINSATGSALAEEMGGAARFIKTDVAVESEVYQAVNEAARAFGRLDIAVNCAGFAPAERVLGKDGPMQLSRFERTIQVNLIGSFNVIRLSAAIMANNAPNEAGERGVIINTASVAAYEGQIGQAAYAASKGGIIGMTLPIAREFAKLGIRVMSIAPGIFETPLSSALSEAAQASLSQQVPFPSRLGRPEEYAHLAQAIIENEMLNGETIRLDGALRMGPK